MIAWSLCSAREHPALAAGEAPEGLLSAPERVYLGRLKIHRRRREWLLGRCAAKRLAGAWLRASGRDIPDEALTVAPDPDGSPYLLVAGEGRVAATLSISHRDDLALCALVPIPDAPLGADLELCEPRPASFVEDFFTAMEAAAIARARDACRAATELWSVKEAALKAVRLGLRADTRRVQAVPRPARNPGWERTPVSLSLPSLCLRGTAFVRDLGRYVASVAWLGREPIDPPPDAPLSRPPPGAEASV